MASDRSARTFRLKELRGTVANIAVVGLGYVGLTTGLGFAHLGHSVVGFDIDPSKVANLNEGTLYIHEPDLQTVLDVSLLSKKFKATSNPAEIGNSEFIFICVPTPQDADGSADLTYVIAASSLISKHAGFGATVVTKSTVPVGSAKRVIEVLDRSDLKVAANPEFLREGSAFIDFLKPDRIVLGSNSAVALDGLKGLYKELNSPILETTYEGAELIKYASNAFLAMKLSFVNDIDALCMKIGADVTAVAAGIGLDSRIGQKFLKPGPGWGGSCFPKDTKALLSISESFGIPMPLVRAAIESNEKAHKRVVDRAANLFSGQLEGKSIAVWGIAFKANTDDSRDSPALEIINRLVARGAKVKAYDPKAKILEPALWSRVNSAVEAVAGAELLIVLTEWDEFSSIDISTVVRVMKNPQIIDSRGIMDLDAWSTCANNISEESSQ